MKHWLMTEGASSPQDLIQTVAARPVPGLGEVRILVEALSINARDRMILAGPFGRLPGTDVIPLSDLAGSIDAVGEGARGWAVGDRVMTAHVPTWRGGNAILFGIGSGSLKDHGVASEYVVVRAEALVRTPVHLDHEEASTLQVAGVTAWNALFGARPVVAGEKVLVIGSGGVSLFAAQLARAVGAEVYAAVRQVPSDPRWAELGFAGVVKTDKPGWGAALAEMSGGGLSKVVNTIGPGAVAESLDALAPGGEVATPGLVDMTPPVIDVLGMISKQTTLRGVAVGSVQMHRDLAAFMQLHALHPIIGLRVPFDELPKAYEAISVPGVFGKVIISRP